MDCVKLNVFKEKKILLRDCIVWTFVWGLIAHGFAFLNFHFVHDSLIISANFFGEGTWEISLGRYFQPIYVYLRGRIAATWLIGVLSLLYISFVVFFVCDIFEIKNTVALSNVCAFLSTNITLTVLYATYIPGGDVFMLANFFAAFSAWFVIKIRSKVVGCALAAVLLALSLATYQAYFSMFLIIGFVYVFWNLLHANEDVVKDMCFLLLRAVVVILVAFVLYIIGQKISLKLINGQLSGYLDWKSAFDIKTMPSFFVKTYKSFFQTYKYVTVHLLLLFFVLWEYGQLFLRKCFSKRKNDVIIAVVTFCLLALLPFVTNIMFFITRGKNSYELTKVSYYILYLLPMLFSINKTNSVKRVVFALCGILIFFNVVTSNQVYTKRKFVYDSTKAQMTRLLAMMSMEEGYVEGETPVVLVGHLDRNPQFHNYKEFDNISIYTAQKQDSSITYSGTETSFFHYVLNTEIPFVNDRGGIVEQAADAVNSMPFFPAKGCCRMIDGKMFVKLSDEEIPVFKLAELPDYSIVQDEVSFWIDGDMNKDRSRFIRGWAYHENDICKVLIEVDGKYYAAEQELRPDVQKAFTLNNDKMGFSVTIPNGTKPYSLYLVNEDKKEIYRKELMSQNN